MILLVAVRSKVNYTNGGIQSLQAAGNTLNPAYTVEVYPTLGPQGKVNLVVGGGFPPGVKAIRVLPFISDFDVLPTFDVPVSAFTNGIYVIPNSELTPYTGYQFVIRGIGNDGTLGERPSDLENENPQVFYHFHSLMAADIFSRMLRFYFKRQTNTRLLFLPSTGQHIRLRADTFTRVMIYPTTESLVPFRDEFAPFKDNYLYQNFVFSIANLSLAGSPNTGGVLFRR